MYLLVDLSSYIEIHKLKANLTKFRQCLMEVYGSDDLTNENFRQNLNQPKSQDIEIVAVVPATEVIQIDAVGMSSSILKITYPQY